MKRISRSLFLAAALLSSQPAAYPWGPTGHRVVGRIAARYLTEKASLAVKGLLGPDSLAEIGPWADEIRSDPAWDRVYTWHFVTIGDGLTYATAPKDPKGDVISALQRFEAELRNPKTSREDKAIALKFYAHLVADVHQPLHVGRDGDRGGNDVKVIWHGQNANLHAVWDSLMIDFQKLSFSEFAEFLDPPSQRQSAEWRKGGYLDWATESVKLRPRVYDIGKGKLGYEYSYRNLPVVRERLMQSAIRLAAQLNSIFR